MKMRRDLKIKGLLKKPFISLQYHVGLTLLLYFRLKILSIENFSLVDLEKVYFE